jgi:hypothetical protein
MDGTRDLARPKRTGHITDLPELLLHFSHYLAKAASAACHARFAGRRPIWRRDGVAG